MKGSLSLSPGPEMEWALLLAHKAVSTNPDSSVPLTGLIVLGQTCSIELFINVHAFLKLVFIESDSLY